MRAMGSSPRIALLFDDELQRRRFAEHIGSGWRAVPGGEELLKLAAAHAIDAAAVGVLNRADPHLPAALQELSRVAPEVGLVGVFEPTRPSLDEAVDLARELPAIGFVHRPGARFDYLARRRLPGLPIPTFTSTLLDCMDRLPLFGPARAFAVLQTLHPCCAASIPVQARDLGLSRRNLERWFQGPDLCTASCFQSVCGAAEAAYLRLVCRLPEVQIASVVGIRSRDGLENPSAVPRTVRSSLRVGLEELRAGGIRVLVRAVEAALRTPRDPVRMPAQWGGDTRYLAQPGVLTVPVEGRVVLMDPARGVEYLLDGFGVDAWPLVLLGLPFAQIVARLELERGKPAHAIRPRLITWLGELLRLQLIRRDGGGAKAANGA